MHIPSAVLLTLLVPLPVLSLSPVKRHYSTHQYYALEHDPRSGGSLHDVAKALGVEVIEQIGELRNHWLLRDVFGLETRDAPGDRVLDALEHLRSMAASRRDSYFWRRSSDSQHAKRLVSSIKYFSRQTPRIRIKRAPPPIPSPTDPASTNLTAAEVARRMGIRDPLFTKQWHLVNDEFPHYMMNVTPLWEMGITGKGIVTALVDDGLDYESPDLAANFDAAGSYDFNDHTDLPTPKLFDDHHGTRCAGQIAAVKNDACGVGIAYDSKVAGIRILSGPITDVDEASALNYGFHNTSIYSCSWGPPDDGKSMEEPDYLIKKSVVNGIQNGRGGKGSIFVFASGNGAAYGDQCNFDGYTNSIYSVTVAAVDYKGLHPYYSESCAANLVVAYSSGSGNHIYTTDIHNRCSTTHGGTSAAAPNAVGVFALALEVRPDLSWRDIQHLCVQTAQKINPEDPDWEKTATGGAFSYKYGYGILNGIEYVRAARNWKLVTPQTWVTVPAIQLANGTMNQLGQMEGGEFITPGGLSSTATITKEMLRSDNFDALEHVTIQVWISHTMRGDVEVDLISPHKIKSVLAAQRRQDLDTTGYPGWTFMTVKHWGEDPVGNWTIHVRDQNSEGHNGTFHGWRMTLWGSSLDPTPVKTYTVPLADTLLPPLKSADDTASTTTSSFKAYPKPTANLPGDHGTAEGEKNKPAFSSASPSPTGTMTPTPDEGWFSDMSNLVSGRKWVFGAFGTVAVFGIGAGVFFWRRRMARRRRGLYTSLNVEDDVPMGDFSVHGRVRAGGPPTKELYDAFGEVSDDEEDYDADEETGLRAGRVQDRGHGFHDGFLDEDEHHPVSMYRDEPDQGERTWEATDRREDGRARSPASVSGDGSWEHASSTT